jgi:hypothetical protein
LGGNNTLRIYSASILLSLLALIPHTSFAQVTVFTQASCTVVYSLERLADKYFNNEIAQLSVQLNKKNIQFIDLNHWGKTPPHQDVSGRLRNILRQQYDLKKGINQAVLVNDQGKILNRYNGSVTLVNALLDCP